MPIILKESQPWNQSPTAKYIKGSTFLEHCLKVFLEPI